MGRYAERPESEPATDDEGNVVDLRFDGDALEIVVTRTPVAGPLGVSGDEEGEDDEDGAADPSG